MCDKCQLYKSGSKTLKKKIVIPLAGTMKMTLNAILCVCCFWLVLSNILVVECSDIDCAVDCACCKDRKCGPGQYFSNECTLGCIDGYAGARCYTKCPSRCKRCTSKGGIQTCTVCHEGYYDLDGDCTSECLPNCKTCTSGNTCTSCKDEYYNDNGSNDCRYRRCPGNCKCENDQCTSCMEGYYDTSKSCISSCPGNCVSCSSETLCESCEGGYYNGYQYDDSSLPSKNDCSYNCRDNCVNCSSYNICLVCTSGQYGSVCERKCSVGCTSGICDKETGYCKCAPYFTGDKCDKCQHGKYGDLCDLNCSLHCKDNVCEKKSGYCTKGCIVDTIIGNKCDVCETGWYGTICNLSCSAGCKGKQCNRANGDCTEGCVENVKGKQCDKCIDGKYGQTCDRDCPNNCVDKRCVRESGNCLKCLDNFTGDKCDRCVEGFYATNCSEICSPYCLNKECNRNTGTCSHGCVNSYSGDRCCINNNNCMNCSSDTVCKHCKSGFFNERCEEFCPKNCLASCNFETGICDKCKINFYGERCNFSCASTCKNQNDESESRCQRKDGKCLYGCIDGFHGPRCSQNCSSSCSNQICNQDDGSCIKKLKNTGEKSSPPLGAIVGSVVGVAVVVAAIIAFIIIRRRKIGQNKGGQPEMGATQSVRTSRKAEQTHTYGNISAVDKSETKSKTKAEKERTSVLTPEQVDSRLSGKNMRQTSILSSTLDVNDVKIGEVADDNQPDDPYYNITESPYRIQVTNLLTHVTSNNVDFEAEFKKLNKDLDLTQHCSVAKQPENIALNRYNGIYPYDHSRVTIPAIPDFFMNACYIDGYSKEKEYIASLGPTTKTTANFSSFWVMVWYQRSDIIVMLTNLREASGMKCEQYWPESETENVYGEIKVKCRSTEEFAEYTVRTLTVSKDEERRQVIQLHYTAWPDKGVPQEVTSLVEFRQRVNVVTKTLDGPIIVHCSAGVGRTGTYIALDTLTQEGKENSSVNVFECVNKMRHQRVNMVQTAEQYKFLYKSLVHSLSFGCETMTAEEVQKIMYEGAAGTFPDIYKSLAQEVDHETKDDLTAREENKKKYKDKNRRLSGIPGDSSRVRLFLTRKVGQHDYINAVFINSFRIKNLFIASQTPLPGTIEDFLSMIFQQNTACVVALEHPNDPSKDVGQYLPADNETNTFGNFSVTSSKNETKSQYILKNLTVKDYSKGQKKSVYHFQYRNWQSSKKVPENATEFVQFIKEVEKYVENDKEDNPNIIAHCLNGFERTGLFCIVYKLLEKLEAERRVSVVNTIRKIRTHRRQAITSVEQLKFCFECISAYLETYNTYTNFAS